MNTPDAPFFLTIRHGNRRESSHIWYKKSPLGKNAIGQFMSKAADNAGLQRSGSKVCNHWNPNGKKKEMVSKANKTLGLIKWNCKDLSDPSTRKVLYCSLVRSKLEYSSNLWSPHTKKHSYSNVEMVLFT